MLKYQWGKIGKARWFQRMPVRDRGHQHPDRRGLRLRERLPLLCPGRDHVGVHRGRHSATAGWHNVFNGIAGIINIFCMTGWWGIYASKDQQRHAVARHDLGATSLPTTSGTSATPTTACPPTPGTAALPCCWPRPWPAFCWNKGGWIQNRAFTLAIWCMFCPGVAHASRTTASSPTHSVNNPHVNSGRLHPGAGGKRGRDRLRCLPRQEARRATPTSRTSSREPATGRRQPPAAPRSTTPPRSSKPSALVL